MIRQANEKGFVLATSLVMLMLMTILTAAVFISVDASQKSSMAAESSAQAFYYAETAVEYMKWSLDNDVEFDSYTYPNIVRLDIPDTNLAAYSFGEPYSRSSFDVYAYLPNADVYGDYTEWWANRFNPSGDDEVEGVDGQLMYYDNSPLANRIVSYQTDDLYTNGAPGEPTMYGIYRHLPRYIMLSIDDAGNITPSMPPVNAASPRHGTDTGDLKDDIEADKDIHYPTNGALIWLTGGNRTDDLEIDPADNYFTPLVDVTTNPVTWDPDGAYAGLLCNVEDIYTDSAACRIDRTTVPPTGGWIADIDYGLVIYTIGYVRGKAQRLVRVVYKR